MTVARRLAATAAVLALVAATLTVAAGGAFGGAGGVPQRPDPQHLFEVTVEAAGTKDAITGQVAHTVYRPADLDAVDFALPIVAWANGGCRESNQEFHYFLSQLASYGYFVVANGAPDSPYVPAELASLVVVGPEPAKLTQAVDWALAANDDPASPFLDRLDPERVIVMGQSCGGAEAGIASADERVAAAILWNPLACNEQHPAFNRNVSGCLANMHVPTLWVTGGPDDIVYPMITEEFASEDLKVPAVWADNPLVGHTGMWDDSSTTGFAATCCASGPVHHAGYSPARFQNEPLLIAWRWLDMQLYPASPTAQASRDFFLGEECGLCVRGEWTVTIRNWS